ncbi:MAG: class II fructose-1,6-bisphosphate aldolase [Candidatus Freyarchaeum deiterrae]
MLVTNKEVLSDARAKGYAVGHFNINNLESLLAITEAAVEEKSPVIVAITPSSIEYNGLEYLSSIVKIAAKSAPVPMTLHLDHGHDVETVSKCLKAGFTSIMIDGSSLDFEENISLTKSVVNLAHRKGVSVEAELGKLTRVEESTAEEKETILTDPDAAKEFVERTGVDVLAVAIGTSHGAYKFKAEPKLDFERLHAIRSKVKVLLVLHGASGVPPEIVSKANKYGAEIEEAKGIPDEHIKKAISLGISKINIDTDVRLAFVAEIREVLVTKPKEIDPRKILGPAKDAMKELVKSKMRLFGSSSKAR